MIKIEKDEFFKTWTLGNKRVMNDKADKSFYPYKVQEYNGRTWDDITYCHTLKEAKQFLK